MNDIDRIIASQEEKELMKNPAYRKAWKDLFDTQRLDAQQKARDYPEDGFARPDAIALSDFCGRLQTECNE